MSGHMRTTVRLNDALLERAKREAVRRGTTLTALMDQGLRLAIAPSKVKRLRRVVLPVWDSGGVLPGVDISNSAALLDVMESRD